MSRAASGPIVAPFRATTYATGTEKRCAPPYDVIDEPEAAELRALDPHNVIHIDLPVTVGDAAATMSAADDAADTGDAAVRAAHRHAAALIDAWLADGTIAADATPALYLYRQRHTDSAGVVHETLGVVGALAIGAEDVLPHERTTPKAKSDRLISLEETQTNLSMIYGLSLADDLAGMLEPPTTAPDIVDVDAEGVEHAIWRVTAPPQVGQLTAAIDAAPVVIADGHHRYEVARRYLEAAGDAAPDGALRIMTFVVPLDERFLEVRPIHRVLPVLGVEPADVASVLATLGTVTSESVPPLADDTVPSQIGVVVGGEVHWVTPSLDDAQRDALGDEPTCLRELSVTWTHRVLLPALGVSEAVFHHSPANVAGRVASGEAAAGVLLPPVSVTEIAEVAEAREKMPPKTTFFWPKARTGLMLRRFADQEGLQ